MPDNIIILQIRAIAVLSIYAKIEQQEFLMQKQKLIVVKIGSSSLTTEKGELDIKNLSRLVAEIADEIKQNKRKFVIVTSGAIVCGASRLGLKAKPFSIPQKQAAAAVGQTLLMREYEKAFAKADLTCAQVLLTKDAIADRERYLNARNALSALLEMNVTPVINENDTVAVEEIKVGDNDTLAALVASLIGADILINLTSVEGFYAKVDDDVPEIIPEIKNIDSDIEDAAKHSADGKGTGGMVTKLQAAKICQDAGIPMVIAHAREKGMIATILSGKKVGTLFVPKADKIESKKRWLAHGLEPKGRLVIDPGAQSALMKGGHSLLAVGIKAAQGSFQAGELVALVNDAGKEVGRGLVNFTNHEVDKIMGKKSKDISTLLGYEASDEVIHRDHLVIL